MFESCRAHHKPLLLKFLRLTNRPSRKILPIPRLSDRQPDENLDAIAKPGIQILVVMRNFARNSSTVTARWTSARVNIPFCSAARTWFTTDSISSVSSLMKTLSLNAGP